LNADNTVFDEISGGQEHMVVGTREIHARAYVASFGFKGSDQQKKVGEISGGERNRVQLAKVLRSAGNVLLLDEPTNDLDVDTLRALEDGLLDFPGCAVVISHDRWFLDRIATHVLAFEDDAVVRWFEGQLLGLRGRTPQASRYRRRSAASPALQAHHPLTGPKVFSWLRGRTTRPTCGSTTY
jgi:sulfate-transporting ATPase